MRAVADEGNRAASGGAAEELQRKSIANRGPPPRSPLKDLLGSYYTYPPGLTI